MIVLIAYRIAWALALPLVHCLVLLERTVRATLGKSLWPAHWRLSERLAVELSDENKGRDEKQIREPTYWLHAASLGECKGLWAFALLLRHALDRQNAAGTRILLTANTTTGLDFLRHQIAIAEQAGPQRFTARLAPLDHPRLAQRFIAAHSVRALVLFEVELWPHWIAAARRAGASVSWISARLTPRARKRYAGHRLAAGALRRVLHNIEWIQTQTEGEEHALRRLGAAHVETGGDLRGLYSLMSLQPLDESPNDASKGRDGTAFVSIHAAELTALLPLMPKAKIPTPILFFPRKLHEVPQFVRTLGPLGFVLHSQQPHAPRVIVDSFGLVTGSLKHMRTAVIGGSFGSTAHIGGHNLWEPLLAGCRLVTGPHYENQRALAERLLSAGLLHVVSATKEGVLYFDRSAMTESESAARREFIHTEHARLNAAATRALSILLTRDIRAA